MVSYFNAKLNLTLLRIADIRIEGYKCTYVRRSLEIL